MIASYTNARMLVLFLCSFSQMGHCLKEIAFASYPFVHLKAPPLERRKACFRVTGNDVERVPGRSVDKKPPHSYFGLSSQLSSTPKARKSEEASQNPLDHVNNTHRSGAIVPDGVTLKMAFDSSDLWAVADLSEDKSERFTSPESLDLVHRLRGCSDCVLVGKATVERDDCTLTVRRVELPEGRSQPVRVVLDPTLSLFHDDGAQNFTMLHDGMPVIVYYAGAAVEDKNERRFASEAVEFVNVLQDSVKEKGRFVLSPHKILRDLESRRISHVMVEGGPLTALRFLRDQAVDRAIVIRAPICFRSPVPSNMSEAVLEDAGLEKCGVLDSSGGDVVEYWSRKGVPWPTRDLSSWP